MGNIGTAADPSILIHSQGPSSFLFRQLGQVGLISPVQRHRAGEGDEQEHVPTEEEEDDEVVRAPEDGEGDAQQEAHFRACELLQAGKLVTVEGTLSDDDWLSSVRCVVVFSVFACAVRLL